MTGTRRFLVAKVQGTSCEAVLDADDVYSKAKCTCSYFFKTRLRAGPCRHLLALRLASQTHGQHGMGIPNN